MKQRVLILCTGNSARSQMAEGLLRHDAGHRFDVVSAGTSPTPLRREAVAVMGELGIDISSQQSKDLARFIGETFDYVLTVCDNAREACPVFPGARQQLHRNFEDPAAPTGPEEARLHAFRRVRDELREYLRTFPAGPAKAGPHDECENDPSLMGLVVRPFRPEDARTFFDIHTRAIRGLAASHYPADVISAWAGTANDRAIERFLENRDSEARFIAELDEEPVGLGCLVVSNSELRACYVVPEAARKGVGTALVREIERAAVEHGLDHLDLHASVNAEPFYRALGYAVVAREDHTLGSGLRMAAVRMRKNLMTLSEQQE